MSRRVLTKITVDELIASGQTELQLGDGDIVTALAKEYAQQRGLRLVPAGNGGGKGNGSGLSVERPEPAAAPVPAATPGAAPTPEPGVEPIPDAAIVRKAVIAAVGSEPAGLDAIIARVMKS